MNRIVLNETSYFGKGAIQEIASEVKARGCKKVVVCTDPDLLKFKVATLVTDVLDKAAIPYAVYSGIKANPTIENVQEGVAFCRKEDADVIVAVGGGSAIDTSKAIAIILTNPEFGDVRSLEGASPTKNKSLPIIAVSTTSGTAAEVTINYVITDVEKNRKFVCADPHDIPVVAIVDPDMAAGMPKGLCAATGMDALTHALEAYVSTEANDFTDALAEKAVTLLIKFLPFAYTHGDDLEAREKVHNASCLAGMAFNKVGLGISHSIAHTIGGKFHLSHGRSNAIVLPHVIEYNAHLDGPEETVCARKYQRMAKLIGLPYSNVPLAVGSLVRKIHELERLFGIPENLKKAGIKQEDLLKHKDEMIRDALADTCTKTNPRVVGAADIEAILKKVGPL